MRKFLIPSVLVCALLGGAALAQNSGVKAPVSCAQVELSAALSNKVILGRVAEAKPGQLNEPSIPTPQESAELKKFRDAPCRADSRAAMRDSFPHEAALEDANTRILNDLIARKISFGAANRRWAQARFDYLRLTNVILDQRTQSAPPLSLPPVMSPEERARLDAAGMAESRRLMDENERSRNNAAGFCPPPGAPPAPIGSPVNPMPC